MSPTLQAVRNAILLLADAADELERSRNAAKRKEAENITEIMGKLSRIADRLVVLQHSKTAPSTALPR